MANPFAGLARTLFIEDRSKYGPSVDLQWTEGVPPSVLLAIVAGVHHEYCVAFRGGRSYSLQLMQGAVARPRPYVQIRSALITGASQVGGHVCMAALPQACPQSPAFLCVSGIWAGWITCERPVPSVRLLQLMCVVCWPLHVGLGLGVLPSSRKTGLPSADHCVP